MHELSIAMSIVDLAQEEADRRSGVQVKAVHLRLGLLSGVVKDALLSSYEMACEDTPLEGSRLVVEKFPCWFSVGDVMRASRFTQPIVLLFPVWHPHGRGGAGQRTIGRWNGGVRVSPKTRVIEVRQNILKQNDIVARALRHRFHEAGVFVVSMVSSPGAGK